MSELRFSEVSIRYGSGRRGLTAVRDASLVVPSGAVLGLVGESGSGKSTLARAAIGLSPLTEGTITLGGADVRTFRRRRPIQMVFQDPYSSLDPRMTIGESISEAFPRGAMSAAERRAEVARLLDLVNLDPERAGDPPSALSGGQRQRIALARALGAAPEAIIADEITSALDVSVQGSILNLVRDLQRELRLTLLFISHNLSVVRYVSDYVAVMYLGRIVEVGTVDEVLSDPQHPYTRELLASAPTRHGDLLATTAGAVDAEPADPHRPPAGCRFHPRCPIGPLARPDRTLCTTIEPVLPAEDHAAACHFAESGSSAPGRIVQETSSPR
ncbi:peptide/nickel transport system ATP-binding protein [Microbacterium resistens]|uniref:Peptide/nickel transport system ATP-binding protein n=1 Tax=Microbacterium resistens TaxID=156977 RepID=A0ABU1S7W6_9MICO|nr:ABC transporter ATP-binding protein [Microbacterium resistens]MDR6865706.1 peptide/nickel transport system ATP-binding protein [Microbacterium resistens]